MDKYVCGQCFDDEFIKDFISDNALRKKCSYCGNESEELIAADVSKVGEFIEDALRSEYGDAVEWLPWESAEGGWQGTTYYTYELLDEIELGLENEELFSDLIQLLPSIDWCDRHPFQLSEDKELRFDWDRFSDIVKHKMRHVFFRLEQRARVSAFGEHEAEPYEILYRIGELVKEFRLCKVVGPGESLFRARLNRCERFTTVADLGPPTQQRAQYPNRFSPAGIPMFYGASDEETAIAEVYDCPNKPKRVVSVGRFENLRALRLLDFTKIPSYPSIFNGQTQEERGPLRFLHHFGWDSTKGITKDGREHIEYVPTQVVTEFFRHVLTDADGNHFDGILYPSAKHEGGICCVIFCSNEDCTQNREPLKSWDGLKEATLSLDVKATIHRDLP